MPLPPPRPREPIGCAEDSSVSVLRGSPVCAAAPSSHFGGQPPRERERERERLGQPPDEFFDSEGQKGTA